MTASVRISTKDAREIIDVLEGLKTDPTSRQLAAFLALRASLVPKPKTSAKKKTERQIRSKGAETKAIRAAVMERAYGLCELCGRGAGPIQLHHAFGRVRVRQAASNCIAVCTWCHAGITNNLPSAAHWQKKQAAHFEHHGFIEEGSRMRRLFEANELIEQAAAVGK